jgi:hypothetical protein
MTAGIEIDWPESAGATTSAVTRPMAQWFAQEEVDTVVQDC